MKLPKVWCHYFDCIAHIVDRVILGLRRERERERGREKREKERDRKKESDIGISILI